MRVRKCVALLTVLGLTAGIFSYGGFDVLAEKLNSDAANGEQVIEAVPESGEESQEDMQNDGLTDESIDIQTVSGEGKIKQIRSDVLGDAATSEQVIFNEKNNGIYFVSSPYYDYRAQNYDVIFYDISNDTYKTVCSLKGQSANYVSDDAIYFVDNTDPEFIMSGENENITYYYSASVVVHKFDFDTQEESEIRLQAFDVSDYSIYVSALGIDSKGRIYLATNDDILMVFDSMGNLISSCETSGYIWKFFGFDATNGNFYYRGGSYQNLMAGNVDSSGKISLTENVAMICGTGIENPAEMLNEKYLAIRSTDSSELLTLIDSNAYDYMDSIRETTNIIKSEFDLESEKGEEVGCVLSEDGNSLIAICSGNGLAEYDLEINEALIKSYTKYPVYNIGRFDNTIVAIEKDGDNIYLELIDWTYPTDYSVTIPSALQVGERAVIDCDSVTDLSLDYTYESSDPQTVSVDQYGILNAWKGGSAVITIDSSPVSVKKSFEITVDDSNCSNITCKTVTSEGEKSSTIHKDFLYNWYKPVTNAYLEETSSGEYERVEYIGDEIYVETYNSDYVLESTKKISMELSVFGGYYRGENYRYIVFGQNNTDESDTTEVIRVVKYDDNWKRLGECSIKGANTRIPFQAGGLDMVEADGKLYIHTCHTMYQTGDGLNHQANCTFIIKEETMKLLDSSSGIVNYSYGYVSHSFAQYVATDGDYIYRVDLGDAYPRGINYVKTNVKYKLSKSEDYYTIIGIPGAIGSNYTGYTLNALEVTENYAVIMGAGVEDYSDDQQNIWIYVVDKESTKGEKIMITDYANGTNIRFGAKKLVKLNSHQFLAMWEECIYNGTYFEDYVTKMVLLDESGQHIGDIYTSNLPLGECDPIVNSNGNVLWYTTSSGSPEFVEINPYRLSEVSKATTGKPGDVNADNDVNISDLMQVLNHVSGKSTLTGTAFDAGDVTGDGKVDLQDLMKILNFVSGKSKEL